MATKRPYHPDELLLDDGRSFDGMAHPRGNYFIGLQQMAQRRAQEREMERGRDSRGLNLTRGGRLVGGPLPSKAWDAYFGLMQAKENAANAAGKRFNWDVDTWGNTKDMDVPTGISYSRDAGEVAPGRRGRPAAPIAAMTGADPRQRGYYRPEEWEIAKHGLERAFRGLR